jgi:hypothetical protein
MSALVPLESAMAAIAAVEIASAMAMTGIESPILIDVPPYLSSFILISPRIWL